MSELFTEEDVKNIYKTTSQSGFLTKAVDYVRRKKPKIVNTEYFEKIHAKIQQDPKPKYYYHKDEFNEIYAISDIHADYKALVRHLVKFEFIKYDIPGLNFENIDTDKFDIYNPKLISDVKWNI